MQDKIHEFDQLQVWELVPQLDCVMIITLKWIYKVKLDEYDDVLKNKARLRPTKKAPLKHLNGYFVMSKGNHLIGGNLYRERTPAMALTALGQRMRTFSAGCKDTRRSTSGSAQFLGDKLVNIMADLNIPVEQAPAVTPPTRTDDQILPLSKTPTSSGPSRHPLRFQLSTFSSFRTPCALNITASNKRQQSLCGSTIGVILGYREEFVQSIQTFLTDRKNLATAARGKKKTAHLLIPSVRFTKLIIHHLRTKHNIHPRTGSPLHYSHEESILNTLRFVGKDSREVFGMPIPDALLTDEIKGAPYYGDYQEHGPACLVVIMGNPKSGRIQHFTRLVQGKGKEKVVEEQAAHDLLTLQTSQKKSLADQFIFQKRPPMPTESSAHAESLMHDGTKFVPGSEQN
ncbi:retrovirus-related pol polyprotein from transposon TNT 1-94 [Tanacetum coccineum]